ncbi:mercaptopyruvate sulfurtransferase, putative [Trypanosoma cruzi]|nr:mercaptopyruvate sulfurtransferase, putative [Trypanosoma cruzi]
MDTVKKVKIDLPVSLAPMTRSNACGHQWKVFLTVDDIAHSFMEYQVFDVRYNLADGNYGKNAYAKGHIPSAIFVDVDEELSGPLTNTTARHPLPDAAKFVEWCKSRGIGSGKSVLCYDDISGAMGACRMWWMLHALGVEAYVLNGGFQAYCAAGLPLETGLPESRTQPLETWPYGVDFRRALTIDEVPPNAIMVDTRSKNRFLSTVRPYGADTLPGHIDNAISFPWDSILLLTDQLKCLKSEEECRSNVLEALQSVWDAGHSNASNCVFYCGSGVTATLNIALLCHLGLGDPFLYCGSWSEYAGQFSFSIARRIVGEHGMLFKMMSPCLGDNPKAPASDAATVIVDGKIVPQPDAELSSAIAHMHLGERAQVFFRSRRVVVIEVLPK